ncbi:MAG: hypothetical protein AAB285_00145, partial [candidate division NC10 bacterium]
ERWLLPMPPLEFVPHAMRLQRLKKAQATEENQKAVAVLDRRLHDLVASLKARNVLEILSFFDAKRGLSADEVTAKIQRWFRETFPSSPRLPDAEIGEAEAVRFLVSEEAGYITGQVIHVNGGMLMV